MKTGSTCVPVLLDRVDKILAVACSLRGGVLGEQSFPVSGYDDWEGCAAGQRQRLLNDENFFHIVDENEGQYRGSNQNARFVDVER